jgi:hypothetical protein
MTIVVSVKVNDGIVLASDSATSFINDDGHVVKVYNNANKMFNLVKVWPIGAMTYGNGSIGPASIATLSKDLRRQLDPRTSTDPTYTLDRESYTVKEVAEKAKRFFFDEHFRSEYPSGAPGFFMGYRICGYSAGAALAEGWEIRIHENTCVGPLELYPDGSSGIRWQGEREALDRLILGVGSRTDDVLVQLGIDKAVAEQVHSELTKRLYASLYLEAMPIEDAIELAFFLADTAARFAQFSLRAATVGGPIEVATITKHEGFKWVKRKHYYSAEFNVEG